MIIQEYYNINGQDFIRTYSDANCFVVRNNIEYFEAYDPAELGRTSTEGNLIPPDEQTDAITDEGEAEEILNIILGVNE